MSEDYASTSSRPASPVGELPNLPTARPYKFTWDSGARRPGPGSVSETTEGRGDYYGQSTSLDLPSVSSLPLGVVPPYWSSAVHGFHAISTVLNNPHKKAAPPKAHSSLPTVPPADLPRVRKKDFDAYLKSIGPEWDRFEKNAELGREGAAQVSGPYTSDPSLSSGDIPQTPRTPRQLQGKQLPPLESVPNIYFDRNFNLGDPRTFNAMTEHHDQHGGFLLDDPASFAYAQPIIDKLSGHADTIEQHLIREISLRSTSFFAALSNLQDLQTESEQCLDRIANLRKLLKEVDEKGAKKGLELVRLESKLSNLAAVREGVKVVGGVIEMTGVAKSLVAAGQWGEALDVVDELNALWEAGLQHPADVPQVVVSLPPVPSKDEKCTPLPPVLESPPSMPLLQPGRTKHPVSSVSISSLYAFADLPIHLRTLTLEIASSLSNEIVGILRADLIERIDTDGSTIAPTGPQMSLRDRIRPLLQSLLRTNGMREAILSWREVVLLEVQNTLKRRIPAFALGDDAMLPNGSGSSAAAQEVRSLDQLAFIDLARIMYRSFLNCVEGLQAQNNIVIEVLEAIRQPKSPIDTTALREDLSDILASAGELAHARAAKVIGVRSEQHVALDLRSFWTLFNVSWDFVVKSEIVCRHMIVSLRGAVVGQAKTFLQAFHQQRLSHSAKLVEDEQWSPAEAPPTIQHIVDILVDASIRDPAELHFEPPTDATLPLPTSPAPPSPALAVNGASIQPSSPVPSPLFPPAVPKQLSSRKSAHTPGKHIKIEDRNFFPVSATLEVLTFLVDYLRVIINLPTLVTDTMSRIIELLKAFNSRTCQVVLGAGAMRSAGLKNITAKHLALASQSLSIMISLIPYIRETFRRHLSQKQAAILVEFDKLKRDYQEHQNEIHAKLIAIMSDRLITHMRSLQAVRWDIPKEGGGINDYMELLVKETVTLHKVLSRYLSISVVEYVMTQVFAAINHRLSEEFASIDLPSQEAKDRLLADARFLHEKLSVLKNVRAPTAMLEIVVQEKRVATQQAPTSPQPQSAATPTPSRFAQMFSRAESLKHRTTTSAASTPTLAAETEIPSSASPDPLSAPMSDVSPSPVPNGHPDRAATPISNGNGTVTTGELVEEPLNMNGSEHDNSMLAPAAVRMDLMPEHPGSRPSSPRPGSRPNSRPGSRAGSPQPLLPSEIMRAHQEGNVAQLEYPLME